MLETYVPCNFKTSTQLGLYFIKGFGEILTLKGAWELEIGPVLDTDIIWNLWETWLSKFVAVSTSEIGL